MAAATGSLMTRRTDMPATPAATIVTILVAAATPRKRGSTGCFDEGESLRLCEIGRHGHHAVLDRGVGERLRAPRQRSAGKRQRSAPMARIRGANTSAVALSDKNIWPQMCSGVKAVDCPLYSTWECESFMEVHKTHSSKNIFFPQFDLIAADV